MVVRIGKNNELKNSRPCSNCLQTMSFYKIKKIIYSTEEGSIECERVLYMESFHISSGWNAYKRFIS